MGEANSDLGSALDSGKSALVVELRARVAELTATSTELAAKVAKLTATNAELRAQVAELEARLGAPPKTPANSSLPPSRGEKANKPVRGGRRKRQGRAGTGRKLHPHPNSVVEARAESCPHCGTDLGGAEQAPQAVYERIELPPVRPHGTRVTLHGCDCPGCGRRVTALAPQGLERGSPFGATIEALAVYLHYAQAISYERLRALFRDVFGLEISAGALANLFRRVQGRFGDQAEAIRERVRGSRVVCSDETSARVNGRKWWEWVFLGAGAVLHVLRPSRSKAEPESVLEGARPEVWVSDLYVCQRGHAPVWQVCLAHQLRDAQYAIDAGDAVLGPALQAFLVRAMRVGQRRARLRDSTLKRHQRDLGRRLDKLLELEPTQADGQRLLKRYGKIRDSLLVFVTDREVPFTNNASERALRPSTIFRKVTNGFRSEWGAEVFGAVRSVIGTGRLNDLTTLEAIVTTIKRRTVLKPA